MSRSPRFCSRCGAPLPQDAGFCHACDQPVNTWRLAEEPHTAEFSQIETFQPNTDPPDAYQTYPLPYRGTMRAMWTIFGVLSAALAVAAIMADRGAWAWDIVYALDMLWLTFALTHLIVWRQVRRIRRRAAEFLHSDRALVRWVYTPQEWRDIREARWREARGDWKMPLGCLPALFGAIGLMVGLMVGIEDGIAEAIVGGLAGVAGGGLAGGVLGGLVAAANYRVALRAYRQETPAEVALGRQELYCDGEFFQADGILHIHSVKLKPGDPALLAIDAYVPRYRLESRTWQIAVPPRLVPEVEAAIRKIRVDAHGRTPEDFDLVEEDETVEI